MLLAPTPAKADYFASQSSVAERFAKSMVTVYITAEKCSQINSLHTENYTNAIKMYLNSYFQDQTPYWVLPTVEEKIQNHDYCVVTIEQDVADYQVGRREYAENYPNRPIPPILNDAMLMDTGSDSIQTASAKSPKDHFLTPSVLVK